jgi:hypothetical protein
MTYKIAKMMINSGNTDGLQEKLDLFLLGGRITQDQYTELVELLNAAA